MDQRGEHAQLEEGPRSAGEKILKSFFVEVLQNEEDGVLAFFEGLETWSMSFRLKMRFQDDQNSVAIFPPVYNSRRSLDAF